MNVAFINPFITSCREVFDTMIHVPITLGKPHLKEKSQRTFKVGVMITLSGGADGLVLIGFTDRVAMALVGALTGTKCDKLDADALDALGEIGNMIVGSAKKNLPGGLSQISVPKIVMADGNIPYPEGLPTMVVPFDTATGRFVIEVSLKTAAATVATPASPAPAPAANPSPPAAAAETPKAEAA